MHFPGPRAVFGFIRQQPRRFGDHAAKNVHADRIIRAPHHAHAAACRQTRARVRVRRTIPSCPPPWERRSRKAVRDWPRPTCGVENSMATSTPRKFSGVMPCWFTFVSMSSFKPTEKPASGASCSISRPIFPYPTMARFLGMLFGASESAPLPPRSIRVICAYVSTASSNSRFGNFFLRGVRHVNAARAEQETVRPTPATAPEYRS